jgi:hypothetical protein
MATTEEAE